MSLPESRRSFHGAGAPITGALTVVPSDTVGHVNQNTGEVQMCRTLYVGVGGDVAMVMADGSVVLFVAVPTGAYIYAVHSRINNTSTDATTMVAGY